MFLLKKSKMLYSNPLNLISSIQIHGPFYFQSLEKASSVILKRRRVRKGKRIEERRKRNK